MIHDIRCIGGIDDGSWMSIHSPERTEGKGLRAQVMSTGQDEFVDFQIERLERNKYKPVLLCGVKKKAVRFSSGKGMF